jgi:hypothetical protein
MSSITSPDHEARGASPITWLALLASLAAVAGTLYLSIGMGLNACPLCLYQRTFVFGVAGVLAVGLLAGGGRSGFLSLLALPLATGALTVSIFHVYLEATGKLECPAGALRIGSAPQQGLAAIALLVLLLAIDVLAAGRAMVALAAIVLGVLLAVGTIASAPKGPPDYTKPVDEDGCRAPKKAP